jgi:DNA-binding response OmpR family regulator
MGTWAVDAFGNDYAQDWAEDLQQTSNLEAVENTLDMVLGGDSTAGDMLDAPFAAEALVAIEVLARLQGKGGASTEDSAAVDEWVAQSKAKTKAKGKGEPKPRADLADKAQRAIIRILSQESELRALWEDSEHYQDWCDAVEELRARIAA